MADPVVIECLHNQIVTAATSVLSCDVIVKDQSKDYYYTYRETGQAAPTAPPNPNNPDNPINQEWLYLSGGLLNFVPAQSSDFYIYCTRGDENRNGSVVVHS